MIIEHKNQEEDLQEQIISKEELTLIIHSTLHHQIMTLLEKHPPSFTMDFWKTAHLAPLKIKSLYMDVCIVYREVCSGQGYYIVPSKT